MIGRKGEGAGEVTSHQHGHEVVMIRNVRKLALTAHITVSVGWIGAVLAYLVLVVASMASRDALTLRSGWIAMDLIGWYLIVPLALASLVTGLVMALGTPWGLFRHYWVLISLGLTVMAVVVLLQHMTTVTYFAQMAAEADGAETNALRRALRGELIHAGLGLLVLLVIEALNVYKPRRMTAYGRRVSQRGLPSPIRVRPMAVSAGGGGDGGVGGGAPRWVHVAWIHAAILLLVLAVIHISSGGLQHHWLG